MMLTLPFISIDFKTIQPLWLSNRTMWNQSDVISFLGTTWSISFYLRWNIVPQWMTMRRSWCIPWNHHCTILDEAFNHLTNKRKLAYLVSDLVMNGIRVLSVDSSFNQTWSKPSWLWWRQPTETEATALESLRPSVYPVDRSIVIRDADWPKSIIRVALSSCYYWPAKTNLVTLLRCLLPFADNGKSFERISGNHPFDGCHDESIELLINLTTMDFWSVDIWRWK